MASNLANRAVTDRTIKLWRLTSSFLRNFSTASESPSAAAAAAAASPSSSASKKPKRKKKKNLFEVAQFLPNWGLGYQMAKTHWVGVSYQITKINLYKVSLLIIAGFQIFLYCWFLLVWLLRKCGTN